LNATAASDKYGSTVKANLHEFLPNYCMTYEYGSIRCRNSNDST